MQHYLFDAYRGELFGIAFFECFEQQAQSLAERNKWLRLIELERHTAKLLKNWLEDNGQPCHWQDDEMVAKARDTAKPWLSLGWQDLMETLSPWVESYAIKYRELAVSASPEQRWISGMVADHEEAIFAFVEAERARRSDSLSAVEAFMRRYC